MIVQRCTCKQITNDYIYNLMDKHRKKNFYVTRVNIDFPKEASKQKISQNMRKIKGLSAQRVTYLLDDNLHGDEVVITIYQTQDMKFPKCRNKGRGWLF